MMNMIWLRFFWDVINENAFDETLTTYREIRAALNEKGRLKNDV